MNILMAASEMAPFAQTGALADSLQAQTEALRLAGHEVTVVLPFYRSIRDAREFSIRPTKLKFSVPVGEARFDCEILEARAANGVQVRFVSRDEFFDRSGLYGTNGRDYQDNAARFIFFNKCVLELARRLNADVIHAHDWQTALLPVFARAQALPKPVVLTIHDAAYQGNFWSYDFGLTNLPPDYFSSRGLEFYGSMNFLKGGILCADRVILPSELAVAAVQTPEAGCGLEAVFREQAGKLVGVPEGLGADQANPATDSRIPATYSANDLRGKRICRDQLLSELSLAPNPSGPVFAFISRLVRGQGMDLLLPVIDRLLAADVRLVVSGPVSLAHETAFRLAAKRHADKLAWIPEEEATRTARIFAGVDGVLTPAAIESSGALVREALKYGALPIALASGGLRQLVEDFEPATGRGNGFVFYAATAEALLDAARRVGGEFARTESWQVLVAQAMTTDSSWKSTAARLVRLYEQLGAWHPSASQAA